MGTTATGLDTAGLHLLASIAAGEWHGEVSLTGEASGPDLADRADGDTSGQPSHPGTAELDDQHSPDLTNEHHLDDPAHDGHDLGDLGHFGR